RTATALGFEVAIGHASVPGRNEAEWRDARRAFLADVAARAGADVATAHTRDDHVETVLMRVLRGAGARGLAALRAPAAGVVRPLIEFTHDEIAAYARDVGAAWVEDPSNASPRFLRNRVRRDLLPALASASPDIVARLLELAAAAAEWREQVDAIAHAVSTVTGDVVTVDASALGTLDDDALRLIWPAVAARVSL